MPIREKGTENMNDTVYTAVKAPMTQHPQKCRIGVCNGTPVLEDDWLLYSSLITEYADKIFAEVNDTLNDVRATNFDTENNAWMIPIAVLDRWMTANEELFQIRYSNKHQMQYVRHPYEQSAL